MQFFPVCLSWCIWCIFALGLNWRPLLLLTQKRKRSCCLCSFASCVFRSRRKLLPKGCNQIRCGLARLQSWAPCLCPVFYAQHWVKGCQKFDMFCLLSDIWCQSWQPLQLLLIDVIDHNASALTSRANDLQKIQWPQLKELLECVVVNEHLS